MGNGLKNLPGWIISAFWRLGLTFFLIQFRVHQMNGLDHQKVGPTFEKQFDRRNQVGPTLLDTWIISLRNPTVMLKIDFQQRNSDISHSIGKIKNKKKGPSRILMFWWLLVQVPPSVVLLRGLGDVLVQSESSTRAESWPSICIIIFNIFLNFEWSIDQVNHSMAAGPELVKDRVVLNF